MMRKCPKCGSRRVAPILYGMPAFSEEMEQQLNEEKLFLGGCCISGIDPTYHCFQCKKDIGAPPILLSKRGEEDYRDIVTSVRFSDGEFFGGYPEVLAIKGKDRITLDVRPGFREPEAYLQRLMTEQEWNKLIDRLFSKLYLHEWKKNYVDPNVLDGEQWELELKLSGGRVRNYGGSNAFPPYWAELKTTFRPFFKEAGVKF